MAVFDKLVTYDYHFFKGFQMRFGQFVLLIAFESSICIAFICIVYYFLKFFQQWRWSPKTGQCVKL